MNWSYEKDSRDWVWHPEPDVEYRIKRRWLKGLVLYCQGSSVASDTRVANLKQSAREHWAQFEKIPTIDEVLKDPQAFVDGMEEIK